MSRLFLTDVIIQKAEEDLMKLLIGENIEPESFNYSPFILRCIYEQLIIDNYSLGLGYLCSKNLIDKYWLTIDLSIESDVVVRIIDCQKIYQTKEIVVLIKNMKTQEKLWGKLYILKKLKPSNDRIFRGSISTFDEEKTEELVDKLINIFQKATVTYSIENFTLIEEEIIRHGKTFKLILPKSVHFSCTKCNMCELPSNYSINPIPNKSEQPFSELLSLNRIGFSSNTVCTNTSEIKQIAKKTRMKAEDFSSPLLIVKDSKCKITECQFGLKQKDGICLFQDLATKTCKIHNFKPNVCKNYPFLVSKINNEQFRIEMDFSCPGISIKGKNNLTDILESIIVRLENQEKSKFKSFVSMNSKWDLNKYYTDSTRVTKEDILIALKYIQDEYEKRNKNLNHEKGEFFPL